MIPKWIFSTAKWVLGIAFTYVLILSAFVQLYPTSDRKLGDLYLERFGDTKEIIQVKQRNNEFSKIIFSAPIEEVRAIGTLIQYEFPKPETFLNIDPAGNIILGIYAPYMAILVLLFFYMQDKRKTRVERELKLIMLHELEERFRARGSNLHDVVINPLKYFAEQLPHALMKQITTAIPEEDEALELAVQLHKPLKELTDQVNHMASLAHDIYRDIAPPIHLIGLNNTITDFLAEYEKRNPSITIHCVIEKIPFLDGNMGIQVFRILQEALGNAVLHGRANHIDVRLVELNNDSAVLVIKDNGFGFEVPSDFGALVRTKHTGLANMKFRAESAGAKFSIVSRPSQGTVVEVRIPAPYAKIHLFR
ncbi:MAG: hypothetical protein J0L94_13350 [Rhodothermia bacterium]|nr:hypothetical protein [Rhodothermia bacterium]